MTVEQTYFPSGGSNSTPAHHYIDFKFKTYAPIAFRYFRDLFGIQPDDFLVSDEKELIMKGCACANIDSRLNESFFCFMV
jgi:hypothetical protein